MAIQNDRDRMTSDMTIKDGHFLTVQERSKKKIIAADKNLLCIITKTLLVGLISIIIGYVVPLWYASSQNVLNEKDIENTLKCISDLEEPRPRDFKVEMKAYRSVSKMPVARRSTYAIGLIDDELHVRMFDSNEEIIVDRRENELFNNDKIGEIKEVLKKYFTNGNEHPDLTLLKEKLESTIRIWPPNVNGEPIDCGRYGPTSHVLGGFMSETRLSLHEFVRRLFYANGTSYRKVVGYIADLQLRANSRSTLVEQSLPAAGQNRDEQSISSDDKNKTEKNDEKHFIVLPIYKSIAYYVWPAVFASLLWLILVQESFMRVLWKSETAKVVVRRRRMFVYIIPWIGILWLLNRTGFWARNFLMGNTDRVVFAYTNLDVCAGCYALHEVYSVLFAGLLAYLWYRWCVLCSVERSFLLESRCNVDVLSPEQEVRSRSNLVESLRHRVSMRFSDWQITSGALGLGFGFYSSYFWILIGKYGDTRYFYDGVIVHLIWATTWIIASLPLFILWVGWHKEVSDLSKAYYKHVELSKLGEAQHGSIDKVVGNSPVSVINLALSTIAAIVTFALPVFQATIH